MFDDFDQSHRSDHGISTKRHAMYVDGSSLVCFEASFTEV
jgi:hypothetical protein